MNLLAHAPQFEPHAAAELAKRLYGIRGTATSLPSERDQNFLLTTDTRKKFVLKIANALEDRELLDAQNQALIHLNSQTSLCPQVVPSLGNASIESVSSAFGSNHLVRLLTYLPGIPLGEIKDPPGNLWLSLGRELGRLDRFLLSFDHPAIHRDFHWDLTNGLRIIRQYEALIVDDDLRGVVHQYAQCFGEKHLPILPKLRRSVIHGDANDFNILVNDDRVVGLIDFGDIVHSYTVAELAVAVAYAVLDKPDPIAVASSIAAGYNQENPISEDEIEAVWPLVLMRLCMSACLAAHQLKQQPDNSYLEISQAAIKRNLSKLSSLVGADLCVRPITRRIQVGGHTGPSLPETLALRKQLLGPNLSIAYKDPLKIVRGNMQYLYDDEGREYLDAYNNVAHVGHCHPKVVQAAQDQMALLSTNTRYLHDAINAFAEQLTATLPEPLRVCFFVNSGSEANELALRLARAHTKSGDLIVLDHAYHGNTTTLIDISPYKHDGPGGSGAPAWVHKVPLPDLYRGLYRSDDLQAAEKYATHVVEIINRLNDRRVGLSAFIAESLPSVAGQIVLPAGYLEKVYAAVRKAGGVCIADEVQTGYGRIGTHFWGFESQEVVPDIVVLGKPIGNGHPIGAVITSPDIAASFNNGMEFFSTFGGNTVSSVVGLAVLNVTLEEKLQAHALEVGRQMIEALRGLMNRHRLIGDVRGSGLFLGVELVRDRETLESATSEADDIVNQMRQEGILIGTDGPFHNVLKIRPPMPFSSANGERLVNTLDKILSTL
ncbi:MAG TPA: aminotransferase class III-fold pyridoxal phosphate-dependent enzyme [Pyrinomonadaceae bacterium]|nr:aminotransferase class III-fold pyridoxal phosphate-dependent enzyme [Pyrinomonadaceae bacterium]